MSARIPPAAAFVAIAVVIAVLTLHRLGAGDVCTGNEAVEGVFVQQMVEHGQLLFPVANGNVPMYKPPLFHWTAAAIDRVLDLRKVTAANLRIPSALYAIAGALLAMLFAYGILGRDARAVRLPVVALARTRLGHPQRARRSPSAGALSAGCPARSRRARQGPCRR